VKIGFSESASIEPRLRSLQIGCPDTLTLIRVQTH
jgi:hypothetical protein